MQDQNQKTKADEALEALEQAWTYYTPEPVASDTHEPDLFEYANAA
ncbi:hypothetical protein RUESEDTHA_00944 [Ruegeria sp. THAF57]|nr:hypothetical protein [Ruegeria sp. THAF57]CAD0184066.1 hypothetical protein RUESEDTHA_00944 [Ruegeria sp. THAF57]